MKQFNRLSQYVFISFAFVAWSCSSDDPEPQVNCSESTLAVTAESLQIAGCGTTNGSIMATGSGGEGTLMYSLNDGAVQASGEFSDLAHGEYTVKVTDGTECFTTTTVTVLSGISYEAEIKSIIENSCAVEGCHNGSTSLPNFLEFSNVQNRASGIKSRTQSGDMPRTGSLTADEIAMIACWVDDGAPAN